MPCAAWDWTVDDTKRHPHVAIDAETAHLSLRDAGEKVNK